MKNICTIIICLCLIAVFFLSAPSYAIMTGLSTEELTRKSDLVIEGEVIDVRAFWSRDSTTVVSRAVIVNRNSIKGISAQRKMVVEFEGGEAGDIGLRVSDVAPLSKGEQVILFLQRGESKVEGKAFNIVGKGQGKYVIGIDGIARKGGYSLATGHELIDNDIPVQELIDNIRKAE